MEAPSKPPILNPDLTLSPSNALMLDELVAVVDFSANLTLLFARCNVPMIRAQLIALATARLADRGIRVHTITFDGEVTNLRQHLRTQMEAIREETAVETAVGKTNGANNNANSTEPQEVLFVVGLEHSLPYGRADAQLLTELNMGRELFHRDAPLPIIFWLPDYALTMIARGAPDFWAWRSSVFEFETDPTQRENAVERLTQQDAGWLEVGNLSDAQKRSRRTVLENLLDDYDDLEDDDRTIEQRKELLYSLAQVNYSLGEWVISRDYFEQFLTICRQLEDRKGEGTVLDDIGVIYSNLGDYETALSFLQQSLAIQQEIGDKSGEGSTLNNISRIYSARGDYETALSFLQQSLAIRQEIGDKSGEGSTLNNISGIYHARGDYETALSFLQQSLAIQQEIGDKSGEGSTLNNISQIYSARGDYETALQFLQQFLAIRQEIGDKSGEGSTLNNISGIYRARGDYETALSFLQQSLAIRQEIGDVSGLCATLFNIGHIHWQNDEQQEAMGAWVTVYRLASQMNLAQALDALAGLADKIGLEGGLDGWAALADQVDGGEG